MVRVPMVRVTACTATLLGCGALAWLGMPEDVADRALTSVRHLTSSPASSSDDASRQLRGRVLQDSDYYGGREPCRYGDDDCWPPYHKHPYHHSKQAGNNGYLGQIIFGIGFYFIVSSKYPRLEAPNDASRAIMNEEVAFRCPFGPICLQSWCCPATMLAHLVQGTGIMSYWVALVISFCAPCVLLVAVTSCGDTNVKLGGVRKDFCVGCLEAFFCSCCVITRANEALDAATGMELGCCSFAHRVSAYDHQIATGYQVMPAPSAPPLTPQTDQALRGAT